MTQFFFRFVFDDLEAHDSPECTYTKADGSDPGLYYIVGECYCGCDIDSSS